MRFVLLLLVLAACPKKDDKPTCKTIPAKLTESAVADLRVQAAPEEAVAQTRAQQKQVEPRLAQACVDDAWSMDIIECIHKAAPSDVSAVCLRQMSVEQLNTVTQIRANANVDSGPPPPP